MSPVLLEQEPLSLLAASLRLCRLTHSLPLIPQSRWYLGQTTASQRQGEIYLFLL
jgi:hypothetical protein